MKHLFPFLIFLPILLLFAKPLPSLASPSQSSLDYLHSQNQHEDIREEIMNEDSEVLNLGQVD